MDITVYEKIYKALEEAISEFNAKTGYNATLSHFAPQEPKYPLVIFSEVRNQPRTFLYSLREQISSLGYRVDIFAKTMPIKPPEGKKEVVDKQTICRTLMQFITDFLQIRVRLNLISNNAFDNAATQGELYQIVLVFQKNYFENREYFI